MRHSIFADLELMHFSAEATKHFVASTGLRLLIKKAADLGLDQPDWSLNQVHGDQIISADTLGPSHDQSGDGLYTQLSGLRLGIKTADCLPLILYQAPHLFALHAGWRGMALGILSRALARLETKASSPARAKTYLFIGPTIDQDSFEVGPEVLKALLDSPIGASPEYSALCAQRGLADRWHIDLQSWAALEALLRGLKADNIFVLRSSTYKNPQLWHSFRREGKGKGSNITLVSIPPL